MTTEDTVPPSIQPRDLSISRRHRPGSAPGTLVIDPDAHATTVRATFYDPDHVEQIDDVSIEDLESHVASAAAREQVLWLEVTGLGDEGVLRELAEVLDIHNLALEDIVNVHQRPRCDIYGDQLFVVVRMWGPPGQHSSEQVSLLIGEGYVLAIQEHPGDCFDAVRGRIRNQSGRLRQRRGDYLAYALLDSITDAYFPVLENLGERIEDLESEALDNPGLETLVRIRSIRRELMVLRRIVWPMRELFNSLLRDDTPVITDATRIYLRDCYDHAVQLLDITDNYRELASGLMDVYLSSTSNRMNEIMKVLTIVSTMFIPLTFIAGIYGMNFDSAKSSWNMPELAWRYGYPLCLLAMLAVGVAMLIYFKRLGWIFQSRKIRPDEPG